MANEWPANDSVDWDDAISANLTTGGSHNASTGMHPLGVLSGFKTITFTRDMTAASGDVAYTGVGFQPRQVVFFAAVAGNAAASWGDDDGSSQMCTSQLFNGLMAGFTTASIVLNQATSATQTATITSLSSTGFTLTWSKTNLPTGTATIIALCLK